MIQKYGVFWFVAGMVVVLGLGGCGLVGVAIPAGTYRGEPACTIGVVSPSGETGSEPFDAPTEFVVAEDGSLFINGEPIVEGSEVTRSIPTADLAFEVTEVTRLGGHVEVVYEPRPTLPGITVEGRLVETYQWRFAALSANVEADLTLTDNSGDSELTIRCQGTLRR